jgi:hypothetical protein
VTAAASWVAKAVPTVADWPPPLVAAMAAAAAALTVTETEPVCVPSLTVTVADSALYSVITPLLEPATVATPFAKAIVSAVPNATAVPVLEVTVGWFAPMVLAPLKVSVWSPLYAVTVFPAESLAVIVRLSPAPAVGVVVAGVSEKWWSAPDVSVTAVEPLVADQLFHTAVTVYWYVPAESPESVQLVAVDGDA